MKPDTYAFYLNAVTRVVTHLTANLDASADLPALADLANLSPYHFHRIFRGMVGETPLELLRRLRLERAAHELRTTDTPITQLAFRAGFETHEAFTRAFRVAFGDAPSAYRQHTRGRPILAARNGVHFDSLHTFIPLTPGGSLVDIHLDTLPPLRLATVEHRGPFNQIGAAFERLSAIAGAAGLFAQPTVMMLATYDEDPEGKPAEELRSRAGITIADGMPMPEGLEEQQISGGRYACHTHIGSFRGLGDAWQRFMGDALPSSGYVVRPGAALEIYRSDMRTTPEAEYRTDLLVPIE